MVAAIPAGDMHDLLRRFLITVVTPIDMKARAIKMGKARRQPSALGRRRSNETIELGDSIAIEGIQGPTQGIVVELVGSHAE